ncbi:MAG: ribonuclease E/G [Lachnospiraceae bacterium]|nr:ribonuclease E/G [Lachnospiraceae bacterium]
MNEKKIILTRYENAVLFMSTDGNRSIEYQVFREDDDTVGNIYVCEIRDRVKSINASFVNYGEGRTGFINSIKYKQGELVPLQLKKAGTKDKAPVFSDEISIKGMYVVMTNANKDFSVSKKLSGERRNSLKRIYGSFLSDLEYGITLRTNSSGAGLSSVLSEADSMAGIMDDILYKAETRTVGTVLYKAENEWVKYCLNAASPTLDKIITDDKDIYEILNKDVIKFIKPINPNITIGLYKDKLVSLNNLYSINSGLEEALEKKVWLKSGGYIYIEQTETLNTIDVNSGKNVANKDKETTVFETNMEATEEICRQIRLRNLSGIIIIDYINMENEAHLKAVVDKLKELAEQDSVNTVFHDVTALSLVEVTRQRIREPLKEQLRK